MACRQNGFEAENCGIKVVQVGPLQLTEEKQLLEYIPVRTDLCHFCRARTNSGKLTFCEHHCPTQCIEYGLIDDYIKNKKDISKTIFYADEKD